MILGSMPGPESLRTQQYYAHSRNTFWKLVHEILNETLRDNYKDKLLLLKEHGIALWDVLQHCERAGSLDKEIKNEYPNDFKAFHRNKPGIKAIFFNGQKAANSYERYIGLGENGMKYHTLPSTSPAHAVEYKSKLKAWSLLKNYL